MDKIFFQNRNRNGSRSTRNNLQDTSAMELSTITNVEPSSLQKYLCLRVDVARLTSKLSNGRSLDHSFVVPDKVLDTIEDYGEKVRVLERHRNYLRSCLEE